jgi:MFS family permease
MRPEPKSAVDRWPSQIKFIVGNEACERFSYYGMRSILAGYITGEVLKGGLGKDADTATSIIHFFVFANYFMPLFGAWLSDRIIGRYHTILWVSLFYCAGHGVLACSDFAGGVHGKIICLYAGLALIAFGSGGIKPCVSAFMGDQFKPEQSHLLQKAYGAFYWSINLGSFFSFLVIPWIKDRHGYSLAFAVPGILMGIATLIFWLGTKRYVRVPPSREAKTAGFIPVFLAACRSQPGIALAPLLTILTTLGIPLLVMVALTSVALREQMTPVARVVAWSGLTLAAVWYVAIVAMSLLNKSELGDDFWQGARNCHGEREIAAARSVIPILFVFALIPVFFSPLRPKQFNVGFARRKNGAVQVVRFQHRRGRDAVGQPRIGDDSGSLADTGSLSPDRAIRFSAEANVPRDVSGRALLCGRGSPPGANRGRSATQCAVADRALRHSDNGGSVGVHDRP